MKKRIVSILFAFCMLLCLLPTAAFAADLPIGNEGNNVTAEQASTDLKLNAPDKVCRTQDYVFTFILPDGCTSPGYSWDFSLKGDGAEVTPIDGVCTVTVKSEWYVDDENTFEITAGAFIGGVYFSESKIVTIVDGHEGGTATCTDPAVCEICGQSYGDVDPGNHDLVHHEAKAATKESEGNIEYWYCNNCEKYFADKDGEKVIAQADTVIEKLPAAPASDQKKDQNASKNGHNAETGDSSDPALWFAMMLLSGGAAAGVTIARKKRSFEK